MAGRARPRLRIVHRGLLVRIARDITRGIAGRSALVLAPHPDDETIGCGATIARKTAAGAPVHVVVATDGGNALRRTECVEACSRLGVPEAQVTFLGLPDGALGTTREELDERIASILRATTPDDVFAPSAIDAHPDHQVLAASIDHVRTASPGTTILSYPVWFWNRWAWVERTTPRWRQSLELAWRPVVMTTGAHARVVKTGEYLDAKRRALAAHASQVDPKAVGDAKVLDPAWLAMFLGSEELFFER